MPLRREPEMAVPVFVDIDNHLVGLADTLKMVLRTVVEVQPFHRAHPCPAAYVGVEGIATGVIERVRVTSLHILTHASRLHVEYKHTVGIGSHP